MSTSKGTQQTNAGSNLAAAYVTYAGQLEQQDDHSQSANLMNFHYQAKIRGRQLDTLLHLSHFSDYLVLVSAPTGAGKSTFIEQFLQVQPVDACIVHLVLTEEVSAAWVVRQLAQQLPVQLPNHAGHAASIIAVQELAQELAQEEQVLRVVVDDAHWLDNDALELLANSLPRSAKVDSRPHVILCANQSLVERIEAPQFTEMRQERFYHLVLAPFSQEESADYLRQRLHIMGITQGLGLVPIQLLQLHQLAKGSPGYLNMLANNAVNKGGLVHQTALPLMHIAAIIVVVCSVSAIWLFNYYPNNTSKPVEIQKVIEDPFAQTLPLLGITELSTPSASITLQSELQPQSQFEPVETVAALKSILPTWPQTTAISHQPYGYAALMKLPPSHYSLQVLGARLESTLEAFLAAHTLKHPYYVLQLERANAPWHLLLVGDYQSSSQARNGIKSLPLFLRNLEPWPRPVLKVQQQIRDKFNTSVE